MYNRTQLDAICAAASSSSSSSPDNKNTKFTLIQGNVLSLSLSLHTHTHIYTPHTGPPGTGKTHTTMGLLNAIHVADYNKYYAFLEDSVSKGLEARGEYITRLLNSQGQTVNLKNDVANVLHRMKSEFEKVHLEAVSKRARILVVAPSNAAVDVIVKRIQQQGFVDGQSVYYPRLVRLGTLRYMVESL